MDLPQTREELAPFTLIHTRPLLLLFHCLSIIMSFSKVMEALTISRNATRSGVKSSYVATTHNEVALTPIEMETFAKNYSTD